MQSQKPEKNQYPARSKRLLPIGAFVAVALPSIFALGSTVNAGLLSSFWGIVGNEQASAQTEQPVSGHLLSSQRYPLPTYSANSNPVAYAKLASSVTPISGGDTLSPDIVAAAQASEEELPNTQISVYVVRAGDSISGVAKMFNVSVNTVLWANDLTSRSVLQPGQTLVILPVTGITYTVKKGDTIQGIAKKYGAAIEDVLNYNDMTLSTPLKVGDEIIIPNAEIAPPSSAKPGSSSSGSLIAGSSGPSYPGYFVCPVPGARVSQKLHGHNGVDLASPQGTPIKAAAAGTVIINRVNGAWNGGYGNFIVILHSNGSQTLYSHLSKGYVSSGEKVSQGEVIGTIGMTGLTTGPHLHLEIRGATNPFTDASKCR